MLSCVSSNYTVAALHTIKLSSSPSGPIPMASGGPKIWMKFCLRKEHRRLQGIIYGKRCGIPKTLAQRRENGGRITSLLLRCPLQDLARYVRCRKSFCVALPDAHHPMRYYGTARALIKCAQATSYTRSMISKSRGSNASLEVSMTGASWVGASTSCLPIV